MDSPPVPYWLSVLYLALQVVGWMTYVAAGEVTSLKHELGDDAVER
jgi:hypothetical protein